MYYTVYKITNLINNKIYVGVHITDNIDDDYMGSGKNIKNAIKKYGIENFKKEYLSVFNNKEEMYQMESIIVNEDFIKSKNTYNIVLGGRGGWDYVNEMEYSINKRIHAKKMGEMFGGRNKLSETEIKRRLELIKDIDLTKFGWVSKVSKTLSITHAQTKRFIEKYYKGNFYRRKAPIV